MSHPKLIMIVDDEEVIRDVLSSFLMKKGYETIPVEDGLSAVKNAKERKPDLILLDIKMPGINGLETCQMLKQTLQTNPPTGIIVVTGYDSDENIDKSYSSGAIDVIRKPFDLDDINRRVKIWFDVRDVEDEFGRVLAYSERINIH